MSQILDATGQKLWYIEPGVAFPENKYMVLRSSDVSRLRPATIAHLAQAVLDTPCQHRIVVTHPYGADHGAIGVGRRLEAQMLRGDIGFIRVDTARAALEAQNRYASTYEIKRILSAIYLGAATVCANCHLCEDSFHAALVLLPHA